MKHALCLVNKQFNAIFSETLYETLYYRGILYQPTWKGVWNPENLRYVRTLHIITSYHWLKPGVHTSDWYGNYDYVDEGDALDDHGGTLSSDLLQLLQTRDRKLETLAVRLNEVRGRLDTPDPSEIGSEGDWEFDENEEMRPAKILMTDPSLPTFLIAEYEKFSGLQALHLTEIPGSIERFARAAANIMVASPELTELSLSISRFPWTYERWGFPHSRVGFIRNLAEVYEKRGGKPLRIRSLKLGRPISFQRGHFDPPEYLSKFMKLDALEELQLYNWSPAVPGNEAERDGGHAPIAWDVISPRLTPNLRLLEFHEWEKDSAKWMNKLDPEFAEQLEIRCNGTEAEDDEEVKKAVPFIAGGPLGPRKVKKIFLPSISSKLWDLSKYRTNPEEEEEIACARMLSGCSWITTLGFSVGRAAVHLLDKIVEWLGRMEGLQQLTIVLHPDTEVSSGLELEIAAKCRGLRFVRLGEVCWSIKRLAEGPSLEELDATEEELVAPFLKEGYHKRYQYCQDTINGRH
ncbi:hypothetical protein CkaCkLH20_05992 [Colletotrichum karsti]|uniref:Uncharacterized protein n=1 Tax=Colletotrichum karsti TaxID=1095194 RepID=A0A9P6LHS3_9PEZI|nr:uncharacterized protein CkaCkLH20_05992 [Colletotrichum karsti]KAF9876584.1 hypothetical protein CkaCkLH20_05992 [Colletotrichum karsti]